MKLSWKQINWMLTLTVLSFGWSNHALAIFDAQLLIGSRTQNLNYSGIDKEATGSATKFAFHLDPIPLIPISFGVAIESTTYDVSISDHGLSELTGFHIIPEVRVWTPTIPGLGISAYAKLGFSLDAAKGKTSQTIGGQEFSSDVTFVGQSTHIVPGIAYSPLPLISILLEYDIGMGDWKKEGFDIGTVQVEEETKEANSSAFYLGLQIGI